MIEAGPASKRLWVFIVKMNGQPSEAEERETERQRDRESRRKVGGYK
jgi:hypothetical protein